MSKAFGRPIKDLSVSHVSAEQMTSKLISSLESIDSNIIEIEKDIFDLQDIAVHSVEESVNTIQELTTVQNDLIELQYVQTLPWFCKSNFVYGEVQPQHWDITNIPDPTGQLFIRYINLTETYTGMLCFIPRITNIGETRHVSVHPRSNEACIFINTNPAHTIRLSSFDIEWFPPIPNGESEADTFVGHKSLLKRPANLNGYVFGASAESNSPGQCVVFPNSGPFYIQSFYLDNNAGYTRIVLIGHKYQVSSNKTLGGFTYYALK
jgi:hypothetical protein